MSVVSIRRASRWLKAPRISRDVWRIALLGCAPAALLLYFAMDVTASLLREGYSYKDQTISELSAVDAPTRPYWIPFAMLYGTLVIAFAGGIWSSASEKRSLRLVACLVGAMGVIDILWPFAPMHKREVLAAGGETFGDTMHLVFVGVNGLLFTFGVLVAGRAFGRRFFLYSLATLVVVLAFGALTGLEAPDVEKNEPTPWIGVYERISAFGSVLWLVALAFTIALWRRDSVQQGLDEQRQTIISAR